MDKRDIAWEDICAVANDLGVAPCAVSAVCRVESAGNGFLASGRPKILFEGHIFWKRLKKHGLPPEQFAGPHPNIVYPKWDRSQYKGGEAEFERLERACTLHRTAALESASWGMFQIMGFNYQACGFDNVEDFVKEQEDCPAAHLRAFCRLLRSNRWDVPLRNLDWAGFARQYNGPAYAVNEYDRKLHQAYKRCLEEHKDSAQ